LREQDVKSLKAQLYLGPTFHDDLANNEPLPTTPEEARAKNRAERIGKQYLLAYRPHIHGSYCWLIVSGVLVAKTDFEAHSHFHWGMPCRLELDRVINVLDVETGERIGLDNFLVENLRASARLLQSAKAKEKKKSKPLLLAAVASVAASVSFIVAYKVIDLYRQPTETTASIQKPATERNGATEGAAKKNKPRDRKATPNKRPSGKPQIILSD
jgi:hypothetical protein